MRVTWLFIACGLIYVVGFGLRILGGFGFDGNLIVFIISVCLIYIVPYVLLQSSLLPPSQRLHITPGH